MLLSPPATKSCYEPVKGVVIKVLFSVNAFDAAVSSKWYESSDEACLVAVTTGNCIGHPGGRDNQEEAEEDGAEEEHQVAQPDGAQRRRSKPSHNGCRHAAPQISEFMSEWLRHPSPPISEFMSEWLHHPSHIKAD